MLMEDYEKIVYSLRGMINNGIQLFKGGKILAWEDTDILDLINEIERKKDEITKITYKAGDLIQNIFTGQETVITLISDDNIYVGSVERTLIFPKDKLWYHYQKSQR
jgi:hypothetical protein